MIRFTEEELNELCGGAPKFAYRCSRPKCDRQVGPYYSPQMASAAMTQHEEWGHLRTLGTTLPMATQREAEDDGR